MVVCFFPLPTPAPFPSLGNIKWYLPSFKVRALKYNLIFIGLGIFEIAVEESKCHCKRLNVLMMYLDLISIRKDPGCPESEHRWNLKKRNCQPQIFSIRLSTQM